MTSVPTFWAKVFVGFRERMTDVAAVWHTLAEAQAVVQAFTDAEKDKGDADLLGWARCQRLMRRPLGVEEAAGAVKEAMQL
jgi:hypothetical protein